MNFRWLLSLLLIENMRGFNLLNRIVRTIKQKWNKPEIENIVEKAEVKRIVSKNTDGSNKNIYQVKPIDNYNLGWYVIAQKNEIGKNKPKKYTIWGKNYAVWKDASNKYYGIEDECPHRGASLSCGVIDKKHNEIVCPYHAYQYAGNGELTKVPGQSAFLPSSNYDTKRFSVVEHNGWIYLNVNYVPTDYPDDNLAILNKNIAYEEPEADIYSNMTVLYLNTDFNAPPRVVTENSLDIMHIGFVHTFGNKNQPAPTYEIPPHIIGRFHCRSNYGYMSGENSMVKKIFGIDKIDIENEFILPHTTIARVKFGNGLVNTIVTSACPISETETRLFVKTYRNFMNGSIEDGMFRSMMRKTLMEDKAVIETIKPKFMNGKFNMKYDKLQNTYKTYYKTFVKR